MTEAAPGPRWLPLNPADTAVTPLELFFDLVFVFALTQVTELMAHDATGESLLRGVLMLGLLWASLAGYAWLCNMVSADAGVVKVRHRVQAGWAGPGGLLDPLLRLCLNPSFSADLDAHIHAECRRRGRVLAS